MPRDKKAEAGRKCPGGLSFNRRHADHPLGKVEDVLCFRCQKRMGCSSCCERLRDLVCLICHDWATKAALREHGPMAPRDKRSDAMKIVTMAYEGRVTEVEAGLLFEGLWNLV